MVAKIKLIIAHIIVWGVVAVLLGLVIFVVCDSVIVQRILIGFTVTFGGVLILRWAIDEVTK